MRELNKEIKDFEDLLKKIDSKYFDIEITDNLEEISCSFECVVEAIHETLREKDAEIEKLQNYIVELYKMSTFLTKDVASVIYKSNLVNIESRDIQNQFNQIFRENKDICKLLKEVE